MYIELANLQEAGGEVGTGLVLRNGAHVSQKYFHILTGFFHITFRIKTQGFITFSPMMSGDGCDSLDFFSLAARCCNLT